MSSGRRATTVTREGDDLPDVVRSGEPCTDPIDPQSEAPVRHTTVGPRVDVELVGLRRHTLRFDASQDLLLRPGTLPSPMISPYPSGAKRSWQST